MRHLDLSIENFPIGGLKDWRFGLITREVYRVSEDKFEINDTSCGWLITYVNLITMQDLIVGKLSLSELNWN